MNAAIIAKLLSLSSLIAATHAEANENSCANDNGSDGSPQRRYRGSNAIKDLPPEYLSQLEHIDEQLRDEAEDTDPIITCDQYLEMEGDFVDPVAITDTLYQEISWAESTEKMDKVRDFRSSPLQFAC